MAGSLPDRCKNDLRSKAHSPSSDVRLRNLTDAMVQLTGEVTQSDCPYTNNDTIIEKARSRIDDAAIIPRESASYTKIYTNRENLDNFRIQWGMIAVTSKKVRSVFFDSYKSILTIPLLPDNVKKDEFDTFVNNLALMIKTWYLNAQYMGNVPDLFLEIDRSKPVWTPPPSLKKEGFYSNLMEGQNVKETTLFAIIVGMGLAGICFWKACK